VPEEGSAALAAPRQRREPAPRSAYGASDRRGLRVAIASRLCVVALDSHQGLWRRVSVVRLQGSAGGGHLRTRAICNAPVVNAVRERSRAKWEICLHQHDVKPRSF